MDAPVLDVADGDYLLPPGKVAMVVTYLQMFALPDRAEIATPDGVSLRRWTEVTRDAYLDLFRAIGTPWLWYGRLQKSEAELQALLDDPNNEVYIAERDGRIVGLLELAIQANGDVEVGYFGFVPGETGRGLGSWLMDAGQRLAWRKPATRRLWVHTCTADDPAALTFYRKMGFAAYARGLEIATDPRLRGLHGVDAGPASLPFIPLP
jgi:GNAT superfamily N-acetyltransferase